MYRHSISNLIKFFFNYNLITCIFLTKSLMVKIYTIYFQIYAITIALVKL